MPYAFGKSIQPGHSAKIVHHDGTRACLAVHEGPGGNCLEEIDPGVFVMPDDVSEAQVIKFRSAINKEDVQAVFHAGVAYVLRMLQFLQFRNARGQKTPQGELTGLIDRTAMNGVPEGIQSYLGVSQLAGQVLVPAAYADRLSDWEGKPLHDFGVCFRHGDLPSITFCDPRFEILLKRHQICPDPLEREAEVSSVLSHENFIIEITKVSVVQDLDVCFRRSRSPSFRQ